TTWSSGPNYDASNYSHTIRVYAEGSPTGQIPGDGRADRRGGSRRARARRLRVVHHEPRGRPGRRESGLAVPVLPGQVRARHGGAGPLVGRDLRPRGGLARRRRTGGRERPSLGAGDRRRPAHRHRGRRRPPADRVGGTTGRPPPRRPARVGTPGPRTA